MEIKGIAKGDRDLRHFTFDDGDVVVKGGVYYYKVNYGKNPLEGEYGDEETGYVECSKVIPLGGKKPKPIQSKHKEKEVVTEQPTEQPEVSTPIITQEEKKPAKRGRPAKVTKTEPGKETIPVSTSDTPGTFEYLVNEIKADHIEDFQDKLNRRGNEGWELCGFDTNRYSLFGDIHIIVVFKRKRG